MSIADIARADNITGVISSIFGTPGRGGAGTLVSSDLILSARGTFYWVSVSDASSPGMYAIEELSRFVSQERVVNKLVNQTINRATGRGPLDPQSDTAAPPVLLTAVEFSQTDITSEMPCLNNVKVFYTFGQNFGQAQIAGEVLLGPLGNDQQHNRGFRLIRDFFFTYRVSRHKLPVKVSIANEVYLVYLKGLKVGQIDPNYHIMPFVLFGTLLDISREDARSGVNPASIVITSGNVNTAALISALQATKPADLLIPDTTVTTTTSAPGTQTTDTQVTTAGAGTTNQGTIGTPEAAILQAELNKDPMTDDMTAYKKVSQTISYMRGEHNSIPPGTLSSNSETYYQDQIAALQSLQTSLGDRIVQHANNPQAKLSDIPDTDTATLVNYGLDPVSAHYHPENFETSYQSFEGSIAQRTARGVFINPQPGGTLVAEPEVHLNESLSNASHRSIL